MSFTATIPVRSFTRAQHPRALAGNAGGQQPIIAASAGAGIVAKCAEIAGADLLVVICTGRSRHLGVPTTVTLGNANATTLGLYAQIDNVVDNTPIVGGIEATDPTRRRLPAVIDAFRASRLRRHHQLPFGCRCSELGPSAQRRGPGRRTRISS